MKWLLALILVCGTASAELPPLAAGQWYEIPNSALRSVVPSSPVPGGNVNKVTAWSGGALDPVANRLYVWGGGHEDYAGNEVYAFDLNTLQWQRVTDPSPPDRLAGDVYLSDGRPRSRHTYDYLEFVSGRLFSFGGAALYPFGGATSRDISEFDPATREWDTGIRAPIPAGGSLIGAHARLDPTSGNVYFLPGQTSSLRRYSVVQDSWLTGWPSTYVRAHSTAAIDYKRRWLVLIGSGTSVPQARRWFLDQPSGSVDLRPITTGDKEIEKAYAPGFDYHGPSSMFVAWSGGGDVYVLNPDDWAWTRKPATSSVAPGPARNTGTYGRFRYVPSLDLFVLMNGIDSNIFVYRLTDPPSPPDVPPVPDACVCPCTD